MITWSRRLNYQQIWRSTRHYFQGQPHSIFRLEYKPQMPLKSPVEFPLYCLYLASNRQRWRLFCWWKLPLLLTKKMRWFSDYLESDKKITKLADANNLTTKIHTSSFTGKEANVKHSKIWPLLSAIWRFPKILVSSSELKQFLWLLLSISNEAKTKKKN